jgi:hypothetical protein
MRCEFAQTCDAWPNHADLARGLLRHNLCLAIGLGFPACHAASQDGEALWRDMDGERWTMLA